MKRIIITLAFALAAIVGVYAQGADTAMTPGAFSKPNYETVYKNLNKETKAAVGTYKIGFKNENQGGSILHVYAVENNKLQIDLEINRGAPSFNLGQISRECFLDKNNIAKINFDDGDGKCFIMFAFNKNTVFIKTIQNNCDFGVGVVANGTLKKICNKLPIESTNEDGNPIFLSGCEYRLKN